ncbi:Exocyst complex component EXO70E2 [Vitis vinifera]|uniref:Exocyst subunit Exo70 family protein n=1 Tax=Vitis vinifera TaxID=29760 RepID=A0A438HME8_VITVI|nr:Exocyst complex component EXO70E2 [Vitis vinifera]
MGKWASSIFFTSGSGSLQQFRWAGGFHFSCFDFFVGDSFPPSIFLVMEECRAIIPTYEGEEHVVAAAHHMVKALMAKKKIMNRESKQLMIWDSGSKQVLEYLQAVEEVQTLKESLESLSLNGGEKQKRLLRQAESILQIAMVRLEEELLHILRHKKQSFEPEFASFHSCEEVVVYEESIVSVEDDISEDSSRRDSNGDESKEYTIGLINPEVIPHLKSIANVMFASNYDQEFCQAFIGARKDALDEYLGILELEKLSIEDVLRMDWGNLNYEIKKWIRAMKIIVRVSMLRLLNFGEAVAIGQHLPEKLFSLLNMYEALADLLLHIDALFSEEAGASIRIDFHKLQRELGDAAGATFMEFETAIASYTSTSPFPGGGILHLTRYVMNYIKILTEYSNTLNLLLKDQNGEDPEPLIEAENAQGVPSQVVCPVAHHLRSIASLLESNLESRSKLYKDVSLQHIFLMNNIHYMVQKVKGSELRGFFGDEWIRKHMVKVQQRVTSYERTTWSSVLSLLREDGNSGSSSPWKMILKERCRGFSIAFEEVYKNQTAWSIPDPQLRDNLRILTSQKIIQAYRGFIGRNSENLSDKHIKYSADDLENYVHNLFEGSPKSLNNRRK